METCTLCPFNCQIPEGEVGKCKVRGNVGGNVILKTYGRVTTMIEGPIEQKPIYHYHPGMKVLSIGSSGCNMFCAFCQNFEISQTGDAPGREVTPSEVVDKAISLGCKGIAFTYSEPFVWYEYVMNVAVCARKRGLKTILKTNGYAEEGKFSEMLDWMDAVNIDVKGPHELYKRVVGVEMPEMYDDWIVMKNVRQAWRKCHLEISTIIIPEYYKDGLIASGFFYKLKSNCHKDVPLHLLKFIPDFKMRDILPPTAAELDEAAMAAGIHFRYVYIDYAGIPAITKCACGHVLVERDGIKFVRSNMIRGNRCPSCGDMHNFEV